MRDASTLAAGPDRETLRASALRAWRPPTPKHLLGAALFALGYGVCMGLGFWVAGSSTALWRTAASHAYEAALAMAALVLTLPLADAGAASHRPAWAPYAAAAAAAALVGEALFVLTGPLVGLYACACTADSWSTGHRLFTNGLNDAFVNTGLATFIYCYRSRALRRSAALRDVQFERVHLSRQTIESRLQAMQARVEPQFLFDTLADVERLYASEPNAADRMLDDLIVFLRAALPELGATTSVLEREIELARAYLDIHEVRLHGRLSYEISVSDAARGARIPPMVLLPLLDRALARIAAAADGGALTVVATVEGARLRLAIDEVGDAVAPIEPTPGELADIRDRLRGLYGNDARVELRHGGSGGVHVVVDLPYERAPSGHR